MNLMSQIEAIKKSDSFKRIKGTAQLRFFGLAKIPLIFAVSPSVRELSDNACRVVIPLNRMTKNHWGSMYFGALAIGADVAAGLFALHKAESYGSKVSLVFKEFHADFQKRPEDDVVFICKDALIIEQMLKETFESGERVTRLVKIVAALASNESEVFAEFQLGLSLKASK